MYPNASGTDEFDLDSIIAEVEGRVDAIAEDVAQYPMGDEDASSYAGYGTGYGTGYNSGYDDYTAYDTGQAGQMSQTGDPAAGTYTSYRTPVYTDDYDAAYTEEYDYADDYDEYDDQDEARQAYIDAREAKAAARREKKAAKAAYRAEKRAARQAEKGEEDTPVSPRKARRSRKQARADRLAAKLSQEEADIRLHNPVQAQRTFFGRSRWLTVRSCLVFVLALGAAYISLAPSLEVLPLPVLLDATESPSTGIGLLLALLLIGLLLSIDLVGQGLSGLFHLRPNRATLVFASSFASILHSIWLLLAKAEPEGVTIPYIAVSLLLLYALLREERGRYAARWRAYQAICEAQYPFALYSHYDAEDDSCRAVKKRMPDWEPFLVEMERPDTTDRFSAIYCPLALVSAVVLALITSVGQHVPTRFFWAFSAILSASAPFGLLCASGACYKNVSKRLLRLGAAIAGARQANLLRGTEEVILTESDLFPAGSISLDSLQNMGYMPDDKILSTAAAVLLEAGLEVGRSLTAFVQNQYNFRLSASHIHITENGVSGEVGSLHVMVGNAALMMNLGYSLPPRSAPNRPEFCTLYVVIDNTLVGEIYMRYQPTKGTFYAMRTMHRMHMNAGLAVQDFNLSPAMIEQQFDLRRGFASQPSMNSVTRLLAPDYALNDVPAAILTRDGAGPMVQVLRFADKLAGAVRSNLTIGAFAGICGILIVFYLVFQGAVEALPIQHLLFYLLVWYVPVFFITQQTH